MPLRPLPIDADALLDAVTARDAAVLGSYLDLRTGAVFQLIDPAVQGVDNEAIEAAMDQEPDRFARVPLFEREYRLMCAFVDEVEDEGLACELDKALRGHGAFQAFHDRLALSPRIREQWAQYRRRALVRWVLAWLSTLGVHPGWSTQPRPAGRGEVQLHHLLALGAGPLDSDGVARRGLELASQEEARWLFKRLAQQLCEYRGEPWRVRYVRGADSFERDDLCLRLRGARVELEIRPGPDLLERFGLTAPAQRGT